MKKLLTLICCIALASGLSGHLRMGPLFSNGMVLQQQQNTNIWGWATADAKVTVKTSWGAKAKAVADRHGRWQATVQTPAATFAEQSVVVSCGKEKITVSNVLIGEVWLASGQSNMEMPLKGFASCPTEGCNEAISEAGRYAGKVHLLTVPSAPQAEPTDTVSVKWEDCNPKTAADFCAAAYFFGIKLQETLHCPVGLINSSLGATRVEGWTPRETLQGYPDINLDKLMPEITKKIADKKAQNNLYNIERELPMVFYNGMIHPFVGYNLKGFLWYQGEANVDYMNSEYATRLANMVSEWRNRWGLGDLPFYTVEICPFEYWWVKPAIKACALREQQLKAVSLLPNMGMVCTNDLVHDYEYWQIHPCMKREVGERLCLWALSKAYGIEGIVCESPTYNNMEIKDGKVIISFNNAEQGFNRNVRIEGFEVCGADSVFHPATYVGTSGSRVNVQCNKVKEPVAVRYCYKPFQLGNLKSIYGLPVVPFRTDKFPLDK